MSHHDHELSAEFPAEHAAIQNLKLTDGKFRRIAEHYDEVNRDIAKIESGLTPASDENLEVLKKVRLRLMDEIAVRISRAKVG